MGLVKRTRRAHAKILDGEAVVIFNHEIIKTYPAIDIEKAHNYARGWNTAGLIKRERKQK